jgi:ubiquitin C-terminal hydrolase
MPIIVYYATRFINGTLDTSFIRHERSECLINECLEEFINHDLLNSRDAWLSPACSFEQNTIMHLEAVWR